MTSFDICFNATSNDDVQGTPLLSMQLEDFQRPVTKAVTAHLNIATAVGGHMTRRGPNITTFVASDWARIITASEINLTGGVVID
jgi:hypothetical protein